MSQKVSRKSVVSEEKDKRQSDSPVKDMKKKMAANAEKEKQASEKPVDKSEKPKSTEKPAEKQKPTEKPADKSKPAEKTAEKSKPAEKPADKQKPAEKPEKNGVEKPEQKNKDDKADNSDKDKKQEKPKQNGQNGHNGVSDVLLSSNGSSQLNGAATVSEASDESLIAFEERDELFPELVYEESEDGFEPEKDAARSLTRREQVKATRTPETPRPNSDGRINGDAAPSNQEVKTTCTPETPRPNSDGLINGDAAPSNAEAKEKVLKLTETPSSDRKLRSDDSPKPDTSQDDGEKDDVIDLDADEEPRPSKTDTNFSKSRVKVSPYRRSLRRANMADQTASSIMANYTGNNTTMEMDITETSILTEEPSMDESTSSASYLNGLRNIRGRRSYKPLGEMVVKRVDRSTRSAATVSDSTSRPTAPVVGRKRKTEANDSIELALDAAETDLTVPTAGTSVGKRMRLLERIAQPFRRAVTAPLPAHRAAEIVGINSDLPLSVPMAGPAPFDPESLKPTVIVSPPATPATPAVASGAAAGVDAESGKRCIVM